MKVFLRVALGVLALGAVAGAQDDSARRMEVPFVVGERAEYSVKFGPFSVGSGLMEVASMDTVRGLETWHTIFKVRGGIPGYRVDDRLESWIHTGSFASLRHRQELSEGSRERERQFEIFPERGEYIEDQREPQPTVDQPLDDGSFLYFIRTIPLEVGKEYVFDRYFRPDRNPVRLQVLRKETIKVPAGTFQTIVVRPIIKAKGVFSENGRAEVWLTDDDKRVMVQLKSRLSIGSINLYLRSFTAGIQGDSLAVVRK